MAKNLFLHLCEELHIPYNRGYTSRHFEEHPYKYTLFGLYKLLSGYGVESKGMRFANKEDALSVLKTPFVAQVSDDLVLVMSVTATDVSYRWYDEVIHVQHKQFVDVWSGVALLLFPTDNAGEPNYKEHRHTELIRKIKIWCAAGSVGIILGIAVVRRVPAFTLFSLLLFILNVAGLYLCHLLLLRQLKVSSNVADRLCNLLKRATCTDILDTPAAKFVYDISWSEIGAAYFFVNTIATLFFPDSVPVLCLFAFASLGYTLWSLWYQRFRAHAWCPLCLFIQCSFVLQAVTCFIYIHYIYILLSRLFSGGIVSMSVFLAIPFSYLAATLLLHILLPVASKARQAERWKNSFRNFKLSKDVFDSLLQRQKRYEVEPVSSILFGNTKASYRLTILTNPYCNPCAAMHARISGINLSECCVEMVFASFGDRYDRVCRLLIAAYMQLGIDRAWQLYGEWYKSGKSKRESFFDVLDLDDMADAVKAEYHRHVEWREQCGFSATPTILINGYRMPSVYNIKDFKIIIST